MKKFITIFSVLVAFFLLSPNLAYAHRPVIFGSQEETVFDNFLNFDSAQEIQDPTEASLAVYDSISSPNQVRLYKFVPQKDEKIPIEVLVPVHYSNKNFYPTVVIISSDFSPQSDINILPFKIQKDFYPLVVETPRAEREVFFEPFSIEKLYHGTEQLVEVKSGVTYFVAIYEPLKQTGDFVLGVGSVENFENISFVSLIKDIFKIKLNLTGDKEIPWNLIVSLFVFISGFVIGLGAVTVIDIIGFLGIKSGYWTETAIRAHKVTKPLIWIGIFLATVGATSFYNFSGSGVSSVATIQILMLIFLVLNGAFLSFVISPFLLKREKEGRSKELLPLKVKVWIACGLVVSIIGWWSSLFLLSWYLIFIM